MNNYDNPSFYVTTLHEMDKSHGKELLISLMDYTDGDTLMEDLLAEFPNEDEPDLVYFDHSDMPDEFCQEDYTSPQLNNLVEWANMDDYDRELLAEHAVATGYGIDSVSLDDAQEMFFCSELENDKDYKTLGMYVIDEGLFGVDIPEKLHPYIDYESLGHDMAVDLVITPNGFVFYG